VTRPRFFYIIVMLLCLTWVLPVHNADAKVIDEHIYLVPVGNVDSKVVEAIKRDLPNNMPMTLKIEIAPQEKIPESAYSSSRKQYNADIILNDISRRIRLDVRVESALVITDVDLYSKELDFVSGASDQSKLIGLISLSRLKNELYGEKPDNKLFLKRVVKEAASEMGHALGLSNCPNKKCVMYYSDTISDMEKRKSSFCHECYMKLRQRYIAPFVKTSLPVWK